MPPPGWRSSRQAEAGSEGAEAVSCEPPVGRGSYPPAQPGTALYRSTRCAADLEIAGWSLEPLSRLRLGARARAPAVRVAQQAEPAGTPSGTAWPPATTPSNPIRGGTV